jgi:hypothetical protein
MRLAIVLLAILAAGAGALLAAGGDPEFKNLSAEEARTLLALARDYDPDSEDRAQAAYPACVARVDAAAADAATRKQIDESFTLIEGAVRRMGYKSYPDIGDEYERLRLAKILAERGWLKQFRGEVLACLATSPGPR